MQLVCIGSLNSRRKIKMVEGLSKAQQIENSFTYHAPKGDQQARYVILRDDAKKLAFLIIANTPTSREQSLAITHLEEAIMWANKAIACNG